ncbi:RidA family protein [Paenibacillus sp. YYML68]|uniref:RidA family protein n=1 Tax=Paenibacillus sp. YYML68 TaxID=2909250 RepID=UPI0024909861|nr:RidA family protein [Paenibacillus sp. YYML68]
MNISIYNHGVAWEETFSVTQACRVKDTIYISGQFSHDMEGVFVGEGDIAAQTRQSFDNLDRVLEGFGVKRTHIAELEVFLTDPQQQFEPFIAIYRDYVGDHRPAATLVGVSSLAFPHQLIEIRAIAHTD